MKNIQMTDDEIKIALEFLSRAQMTGKEVPAYAQVYNKFSEAMASRESAENETA